MSSLHRPTIVYGPDRTKKQLSKGQTENWVWSRPNTPKNGYGADRTDSKDRNSGIGQAEQTKLMYGPNRTDQNSGMGQAELTEISYGSEQTDQKQVWERLIIPVLGRGPHPESIKIQFFV